MSYQGSMTGVKEIVSYTEKFVTSRFVIRGFTVLRKVDFELFVEIHVLSSASIPSSSL